MEMLNSMLLSFDLWAWILGGFSKWIINYGWMIIVFTIILKLVMTPLDVYQRISSKKQARISSIMQPEMQALQQKYGNDRERLNQESAKLYKKYNINMGGMCLSMLLTLGLSLVVFFTLFSSLRKVGNVKLAESYRSLDNVAIDASAGKEFSTLTEDELADLTVDIKAEYENVKDANSWLWVKNVWKSDTNTSQFISFDNYVSFYNIADGDKEEARKRYDFITKTIDGEKQASNGYYILMILAVAVSFLSQLISTKLLAPKGQKLNTMNKVMMVIIPLSMLFFVMSSNAVFALYIIVNSIMTTLISTVITFIMNKMDKGKSDEEIILSKKKVEVVEYSRNYKK